MSPHEGWLAEAGRDLRHGARSLLRSPAFSAAVILTLALGLAANTAVFRIVHAVLIEPLPWRAPERLVHAGETEPRFPLYQVAAPDFFDWQRSAQSFEGLAAHTFEEMNRWVILGDGEAEPVHVVQASAGLFPLLGVRPIAGRAYTEAEERQKAAVVVLGEGLWRRKYHADPAIVGRAIRLVGWSVMVVGVISQRQAQPHWGDVWMPLTQLDPALTESRRFHALEVIGRLKPGVTAAQADGELRGISARLAQLWPDTNRSVGATVRPMSAWLTGGVRPALAIVWAAVSLVLLLACLNVAHLVLVRAAGRSRELGLRLALGAGPFRLARFLLAESLLLAAAGGALGTVLARLAMPWLAARAGSGFERLDSATLPAPALLFGAAAAAFCALACVLPAVRFARRLDLQQAIQQSGGASLADRRSRFGAVVLAGQVALAFVVLAGAGLLYRSYAALLDQPLGFDARNVLAAEVPLAFDWAKSPRIFDQKAAPLFAAIPGVRGVAAANIPPMTLAPTETSRFTTRFGIPGQVAGAEGYPLAQIRWTTPAYFQVLGIPLLSGRLFSEADTGKPGCLVNQALARRYFPGQNPVGRRILRNAGSPKHEEAPILGVVGDVRDLALDVEPQPTIYDLGVSNRIALLIKTEGNPALSIPAVRSTLRALEPEATIRVLAPLAQLIEDSLARRRFGLELLGVFAFLAAILTAVGVYGVVSYSLGRRQREFAIRRALGARNGQIAALLARRFALPTLGGLALGAALAGLFAGVLRTQLYKLSPIDPVTLVGAALGLLLVVFLASLRPALAAASISPGAIPRE